MNPFMIDVRQADIDDLKRRLADTRFPDEVENAGWDYGTSIPFLRKLVEHWRTRFDWRKEEARLNGFRHFTTELDGERVHFIHASGAGGNATPILLANGWPSNFVELLPLVPLLTRELDGRSFDVVIPSIPGFGFSTPLVGADWTIARVARTFDALMRRLGYAGYGAHGSDAGALVSRELAVLNPDGFLGAHVLQLFSFPSGDPSEFEKFTAKDHAALEFLGWFQSVGGYNTMNGTRPQTIAAALSDSPVGQLAYNELFENFGNGTSLVSAEQVLTQASLYWLTNTSATAVRYHFAEGRAGGGPVVSHGRIGVAVFADDFQTIRPLAERDNTRIEHWAEYPTGGHYAALEVPDVLVADLRTFFAG